MTIATFNDLSKYRKDGNDQISDALKKGSSLEEACSEVGLTGNNTSFITKQMRELMKSSVFNQSDDVLLGHNGGIQHDGQTQCGVYTIATGGRAKIDIDLNNDGEISEDEKGIDAAQAMAASYDSELDLYIEDSIQKFIKEELNGDTSYWWDGHGFMTEEAQKKLYDQYGIVITQIGDDRRTYSFSLVDEEGNVVEDANGNKASILWGDWVIPDGYAQGAELNLSSILDSIGYDCVSKADFVFNEELGGEDGYNAMIAAFHQDAMNLLDGKETKYMQKGDTKVEQMYGNTEIITLATGGGKISSEELSELAKLARQFDINLNEIYSEEDSKEEAKAKLEEALKKAGASEKQIKEAQDKDAAKALDEAVKEYQERLEENPDTNQEDLLKEIAEEFGVDVDVLEEEI